MKLEMVYIACQLCGEDDAEPVYKRVHETGSVLGRLEVQNVLCRSCGFMYANPRPTKQALLQYYAQEVSASGSVYHATTEGSRDARLAAEQREFFLNCLEAVRSMGPGSVLDIGCSTGDLLSALGLAGWRLVGVEPSVHAAKIASSRGIEVIPRDLESASLPEATFDVVSCIHVLEHMYDVKTAMSVISSIVKPAGLVIIEVPDSTKPVAQIAEFFSFEHVSYFTRGTLTRLLGDFGFEAEKFDTDVSVPNLRVCAKKRDKGEESRQDEADDREELLAALSKHKEETQKLEQRIADRFTPLIAQWKKTSARVAIYGAGMHARFLLELVDFNDCIVCMLDTDPRKHGTRFVRWEVRGPQMIEKLGLDAIVISSRDYQEEIYETIAHYQDTLGIEVVKCYP